MSGQKPTPQWIKDSTSQEEYKRLRNHVRDTANRLGFDWIDCWNIIIEMLETRHRNFLKGKAKNDLTLEAVVNSAVKQLVKERAERTANAIKSVVGEES